VREGDNLIHRKDETRDGRRLRALGEHANAPGVGQNLLAVEKGGWSCGLAQVGRHPDGVDLRICVVEEVGLGLTGPSLTELGTKGLGE